jgi:exopolyphosphatase/guanosine-5'-triphosphate,3'-diphosphate pyrophosphatase
VTSPRRSTPSRPAPRDSGVRAAIDIGTNSIHMVVARVDPNGGIEVLTREKESVRLGHGSGEMRSLEPDAIDRGIAALTRMRRVADVYGARIRAVATSAVREAANKDQFLTRARDEAGIDVEVIAGVEEARLIHLGVLQSVPVFDRRHLVVDIGGGSTEFVIGKAGQRMLTRSVKLGAIRVTDRFFPGGLVRVRSVREAQAYLRAYLAPLVHEVEEWGFDVAVGSSGTITSIAAMAEHRKGRDPARGVNNVSFDVDDLGAIVDTVLSARTSAERAMIPGLDPKRADIITGGAVLLEQIFGELDITEMIASEAALREGVLLDSIRPATTDAFHHLSDIRRQGVQRVLAQYERDRAHVEHSTDLALALFDGTRRLHGLGHDARDLLEAGGVLHNIGLFVSHSAHHKHSSYLIRNTDQLVGFTQRELEIMALLARYHRKSTPTVRHPELAALTVEDQQLVRVLAGLLRVGIALDRSHTGGITSVRCTTSAGRIRVAATVRPGHDPTLELYTAEQRKDLLAATLECAVELRAS